MQRGSNCMRYILHVNKIPGLRSVAANRDYAAGTHRLDEARNHTGIRRGRRLPCSVNIKEAQRDELQARFARDHPAILLARQLLKSIRRERLGPRVFAEGWGPL